MKLADITFYTPDKAVADAANASGCGVGQASCNTSTLDISASDVIDTLNPLEHIPFVSTLYDAITGSKPSSGAQLAGGALFGGPLGLIYSAVSVAFQGETGHDVVGSVVTAMVSDEKPAATQYADASATNAASFPGTASDTSIDPIVSTPVAEILPPATLPGKVSSLGVAASNQQQRAQDILNLFDAQSAAAHNAYRRSQSLTSPANSSASITM